MKGLSIKRLAAVGIGAALIGTAVAPVVSADFAGLTRGDLYNEATGAPMVSVVAGTEAMASDWAWAANIAAKLASKAYSSGTVQTSVSGSFGNGVAQPVLDDVSAVFSLGRTLTIGGENVKAIQFDLNTAKTTELDQREDGNDDGVVTLLQGSLPFLRNETVTKRVGSTTTDITVQEKISITGDTKFNSDDEVEDLQLLLGASGIQYIIDLGGGLNAVESDGTDFLDNTTSERQEIYFFGELYLVRSIQRGTVGGTNGFLELIRSASDKTYSEGDEITGLVGKGKYEGQEMKVVVGEGFAQGSVNVISLALYDAQGNLVDEDEFIAGDDEGVFVDENGDEVLRSGIFVQEINKRIDEGFQEVYKPTIIVGDNRIELRENRGFPFDEDDTDGIYDWDVSLIFSGDSDCTSTGTDAFCVSGNTDDNTLQRIVVFNEALTFDNDDSYLRATGRAGGKFAALNPNRGFEKAVMKTDEGEPFIEVEYGGWESEVWRFLAIGRGPTDSIGYIDYTDNIDVRHKIPFYIPNLTTITAAGSGRVFTFDQGAQSYYYEANTSDVNITVGDNNLLNGAAVDVNVGRVGTDSNISVGSQHIFDGKNKGPSGASNASGVQANCFEKSTNEVCVVNGIAYIVSDDNVANIVGHTNLTTVTSNGSVSLLARSTLRMIEGTSVSGTIFPDPLNDTTTAMSKADIDSNSFHRNYGTTGVNNAGTSVGLNCGNALNNRMYLDDGNFFEVCPLRLEGLNDVKFEYVPAIVDSDTRKDLELVLDDQNLGTQEGGAIAFRGTSIPASAGTPEDVDFTDATDRSYYAVDDAVFGHPDLTYDNSDDDYFNAVFRVDEGEETTAGNRYELTLYIDTSNDRLVDSANPELAAPKHEVAYTTYDDTTTENWTLRSDNPEIYMSKAYTDFGSLVETDGSRFTAFYPEERPESYVYVIGRGEVTEVETGGREYTVREGETVTTDDGTSITLARIGLGSASCAVTGTGGATPVCTATPSTYQKMARVGTLVYLDSDAPAGTNVIVGGPVVNRLARDVPGLADRLSRAGDVVAEVDASTGDFIVAGYTAGDTGKAAQQLIDAIDRLA